MTTTDEKIDALTGAIADLRVAVAELAGEVKAALSRADQQDKAQEKLETQVADLEKRLGGRIAALERWRWSIPSLAAVLGLAGLLLALYDQYRRQ